MTTTQALKLDKATATNKAALAFAVVLAISGVAPVQTTQASSYVEAQQGGDECVSGTNACQDVDTLLDQAAVQQQKIEKSERLSLKFKQLVQQWRDERPAASSVAQMAMVSAYQQIIGLGPDAIPMILAQLKSEGNSPNHWFWALASITRDNPVPKESRGKLQEMAKAWLAWGETKGYV